MWVPFWSGSEAHKLFDLGAQNGWGFQGGGQKAHVGKAYVLLCPLEKPTLASTLTTSGLKVAQMLDPPYRGIHVAIAHKCSIALSFFGQETEHVKKKL